MKAARPTKPKAAAKKAAAPRRSAAPMTIAACERDMRKHEAAFRAYMGFRKIKKRGGDPSVSMSADEARAKMEEHRGGYTTYWRAYERRRALRKEAA